MYKTSLLSQAPSSFLLCLDFLWFQTEKNRVSTFALFSPRSPNVCFLYVFPVENHRLTGRRMERTHFAFFSPQFPISLIKTGNPWLIWVSCGKLLFDRKNEVGTFCSVLSPIPYSFVQNRKSSTRDSNSCEGS